MSETIAAAAIRRMGLVYSVPPPGRHHDVIRKMTGLGFGPGDMHDQGFTTSTQRYVSRQEAVGIARAAGQIKVKTGPDDQLFSEDLW